MTRASPNALHDAVEPNTLRGVGAPGGKTGPPGQRAPASNRQAPAGGRQAPALGPSIRGGFLPIALFSLIVLAVLIGLLVLRP